jgi:hypothetical protein
MEKLRRFYNQNQVLVIAVALFVAILVAVRLYANSLPELSATEQRQLDAAERIVTAAFRAQDWTGWGVEYKRDDDRVELTATLPSSATDEALDAACDALWEATRELDGMRVKQVLLRGFTFERC